MRCAASGEDSIGLASPCSSLLSVCPARVSSPSHPLTASLTPSLPRADLRIDGRRFDELRTITLLDLKARARGDNAQSSSVWARGGGVGGRRGNEGYGDDEAPSAPEETPVASVSLKDFVGESSAPAPAAASGGFGGSWDPFDGEGGGSAAPAPAAVAPPVPVRKTTTTTSTTGATTLKPPTAGGGAARTLPSASAVASSSGSSSAYDPFADGPSTSNNARRPSGGNVGGLADDLMGLSFGGSAAPSVPARRTSTPSAPASNGLDLDLFGSTAMTAPAPAPVMAAAPASGLAGGLDDLFGSVAHGGNASSLLDFSGKSGA
jgi:hypothetical protein